MLSLFLEKRPRRPWDRAYCFLHFFYCIFVGDDKPYIENTRMHRRNTWVNENNKSEPVSSTSRRGARAAYHDEYPRDFGPRIAYTVSLVSDTSRPPTLCRPPIWQGGREMSAPRPYETYPFHPPALFALYTMINFYIYTKLFQLFLPCGFFNVSWNTVELSFVHALFQNGLFQGSVPFRSHFVLYVVRLYIRIGKRYSETLPLKTQHRCTAIWRWCNQRANFASLRNETVIHILTAPVHPPSNGGTFCSNWNFHRFFKAEGSNSIRQDLARFLFSYIEQLQIAQQVKRQLSYFLTVD